MRIAGSNPVTPINNADVLGASIRVAAGDAFSPEPSKIFGLTVAPTNLQ
jgi:hypothetical protein